MSSAFFIVAVADISMSPATFAILGLGVIAATAFVLFKIFNEVWKPFEHRLGAERASTLTLAKEQTEMLIKEHGRDPAAHLLANDDRYTTRREFQGAIDSMREQIEKLTDIVVDTRNIILEDKKERGTK